MGALGKLPEGLPIVTAQLTATTAHAVTAVITTAIGLCRSALIGEALSIGSDREIHFWGRGQNSPTGTLASVNRNMLVDTPRRR